MSQIKVFKVWRTETIEYKMAHACNTEWMGRRGLMFPNSIHRDIFRLVFGVRNMGTVWNTKRQKREKLYTQKVSYKPLKKEVHEGSERITC
jgi:hypothetical protein